MAQFQQEALITARVTHPNVIKLFSVGYDQGAFLHRHGAGDGR